MFSVHQEAPTQYTRECEPGKFSLNATVYFAGAVYSVVAVDKLKVDSRLVTFKRIDNIGEMHIQPGPDAMPGSFTGFD